MEYFRFTVDGKIYGDYSANLATEAFDALAQDRGFESWDDMIEKDTGHSVDVEELPNPNWHTGARP